MKGLRIWFAYVYIIKLMEYLKLVNVFFFTRFNSDNNFDYF